MRQSREQRAESRVWSFDFGICLKVASAGGLV